MTTPGAEATELDGGGWQLRIPAGTGGVYRLAQLDDYTGRRRKDFLWRPPFTVKLYARASSASIPGTWGFGLWNDPFSLSLGLGGGTRRFPALPNTAWFFFASPQNFLSLRDDLPSQGLLAATFRSSRLPLLLLAPATLAMPLLLWRPTARALRRAAARLIHQDAARLEIDPSEWRHYSLTWQGNAVSFAVDGQLVLETRVTPQAPLGLVLWIDNQYAAFPPDGRLAYGTLPNEAPASIDIKDLTLEPLS